MSLLTNKLFTIIMSLYFWLNVLPLALHSFPTRRSSDLVGDGEFAEIACDYFTHDSPFRVAGFAVERDFLRSEEHTSELQSHHDLVCRLLLEKKKGPDC